MSNALKFAAGTAVAAPLYSDDVLSCFTFAGNSSTQTITTGIDLSTDGGLLWIKNRTDADVHQLFDTTRGATYAMESNATTASTANADTVTAFGTTGFSLGADVLVNETAKNYIGWSFRNADRFFSHTSVVKTGGSNATASFPGLGTIGMVAVKRTDAAGSWYVWHRSCTAGKLLYLEQTAAEATLGEITVSGTTVTLVNGVIADGTYIVYAWAHDTEADGIIQCGTFTTDAGGLATVTLGWEPQYVLMKSSSNIDDWMLLDSTRGWDMTVADRALYADLVNAEADSNSGNPTATGFYASRGASRTYIYLAIRRPNKPPTVGTQVYNAIASNSALGTQHTTNFPVDMQIMNIRGGYAGNGVISTRLLGVSSTTTSSGSYLQTINTNIESTGSNITRLWDNIGFQTASNWASSDMIYWNFRRAPGFFDVVCYTGTGATLVVNHNLGVIPELTIIKSRSNAQSWLVIKGATSSGVAFYLDTTDGNLAPTNWFTGTATTTSITVGNAASNPWTYVAYLFATLAGISKVGSYTGTAATLQINCGFTTGARFVLIKRTNSTGDWYAWDTVRGIIAGNDPYLLLNSTAAEVTTTDYIDPYSAGFEISSTAPAAINASGGTYIFLAIA